MSALDPLVAIPLRTEHRDLLTRACRAQAKRLRRYARNTDLPEIDREQYAISARRASTLASAGARSVALVVSSDNAPTPRDEIDVLISEALALRTAVDAHDHADQVRTLATLAHLVDQLTRTRMSEEERQIVCPDDTYTAGGRIVRWPTHERNE